MHDSARQATTACRRQGGVRVYDITDPSVVDALTGNAAFNAVAVRVEAVRLDAPVAEAAGA